AVVTLRFVARSMRDTELLPWFAIHANGAAPASIETIMTAATTIHPVLHRMVRDHPRRCSALQGRDARNLQRFTRDVSSENSLTLSVADAKPNGNGAAAGRASAQPPIHPKRRLSIVISMQRVAVVTLLVTGLVMGGIGGGVAE